MRCLLSICFVETKSDGEQHEHVIPLSLSEFESLCRAQIDKLHQIINKVFSKQLSSHLVVLAGGSSRLQCVQKYFSTLGYYTFKLSYGCSLRAMGEWTTNPIFSCCVAANNFYFFGFLSRISWLNYSLLLPLTIFAMEGWNDRKFTHSLPNIPNILFK